MIITNKTNTKRIALSAAETTRSQWTVALCMDMRLDSLMGMRNHKRISQPIREGQS